MGKYSKKRYRRGFTLFEIKLAIAVLGLSLSLAAPSLLQSHTRTVGRRILEDCHHLDQAITEWANETKQKDGTPIDFTRVRAYLRMPEKRLVDELGNPYEFGVVGKQQIMISRQTKSSLEGSGVDWGAY